MGEDVTQYQSSPQARFRLFCFPYAGGGASIFRGWPRELPSWIEVFGIQLPGRENRLKEPLFTHMASVMQQLIPNIHGYLDCPFAFFYFYRFYGQTLPLTRRIVTLKPGD